MPYIVLDEAQTNVVSQAKGEVEIRDRNGKHLGYLAHRFTDDDVRIARTGGFDVATVIDGRGAAAPVAAGTVMARYTVLSYNEATNELAEIWVESLDRKALTEATNAVEVLRLKLM